MLPTEQTIPAYLRQRPRWRGFPIPFTTLIRDDGTPDFKVTDQRAWAFAVSRGACGLCGEPLVYWQAFIGGGRCKESRLFFDPAMHIECAQYAIRVCPFLVGKSDYSGAPPPAGVVVDEHCSAQRPPDMYLFKTRGYRLVKIDGKIYIQAEPFKFIERLPQQEEGGSDHAM